MADADQPLTVTSFAAHPDGPWRVVDQVAVHGDDLPPARGIWIGDREAPPGASWMLRGTASHLRYITAADRAALQALSPPLGRTEATHAALIPIRKSAAWWALAQDERQAILLRSMHLATGMQFLPAIARRLYHSRDLGEPFDFITWFEFAAEDEMRFSDMLALLRGSEEWSYVEREVDLRLERID